MDYEYRLVDRKTAIYGAKRLAVDSIWKMANIELATGITFPETQVIFDGAMPKNTDIQSIVVVNNLKRAWKFLVENVDYPIDIQLVREYNKIIGTDDLYPDPGKIRTMSVNISGTKYVPDVPLYEDIREKLDIANQIENPIEKGLYLFDHITREQWFNNGNKRTANMVANHVFLQNNAAVLAIPDYEKENFLDKLVGYYESNDPTELNDYLYNSSVEMLPSGLTMPKLKENELSYKRRLAARRGLER